MATSEPNPAVVASLQGVKYFKLLGPLLCRLHDAGTERDRSGRRRLFFDHYVSLLLLAFFNPALRSLRGLQSASELKRVRQALGCARASLGSLSEAAHVFDADLIEPLLTELAGRLPERPRNEEERLLQGLTAVDGTLLQALPKMAWALWLDPQHRAAKVHLHFEVFRAAPVRATLTDANASEKAVLADQLQPGRLYVADAGFVKYQLFQAILQAGSSFIVRLGTQPTEEALEHRALSEEAKAQGILADRLVHLGSPSRGGALRQALRIVEVRVQGRDGPQVLRLATDRLDLPAEVVALAYRYRWQVELFFRWFKCVLGCRHLFSTCANGVRIQVYAALIVGLLISLWTGHKPTKRTLEMIQHYFNGWADWEELQAHIQSLSEHRTARG
jgi:IS4 transposase